MGTGNAPCRMVMESIISSPVYAPYLKSNLPPSQLHRLDFEVNSCEGNQNHVSAFPCSKCKLNFSGSVGYSLKLHQNYLLDTI